VENDAWIINWLEIEPKLENEDLKPYFYFSRESIRNTSFAKQQSLGKSDLARNDAIKNASNINGI
jgi:hypothetical protein